MNEGIEKREAPKTPGRVFLEKLKNGESIEHSEQIAVVVAHQDDESIGFGAQLPRMPGCTIVHLTDGAPEDENEWQAKGYESREAYAVVRQTELKAALDLTGHTGPRLSLEGADQEAPFRLVENAKKLAQLFKEKGIRVVMTHAYEGGHPDHDAVAFAVHAAKKLLAQEGISLSIVEAPYYRYVNGESVGQRFVPAETETFVLSLSEEQQKLKTALYAAHASQHAVFAKMSSTTEWMREAPDYDFNILPNEGVLSRIYIRSGMTDRWATLAKTALEELRG